MLTLMWLSFEGLRVSYFTKSKKEPNGHVATWQRGDSVSSGFRVRESITVPLHASREKCAQHLADSPKIFKNLLPILGSCVSLELDHVSVLTLPFTYCTDLDRWRFLSEFLSLSVKWLQYWPLTCLPLTVSENYNNNSNKANISAMLNMPQALLEVLFRNVS